MKNKGIMLGLILLVVTIPALAQEVQPKTSLPTVNKWVGGATWEPVQTKAGSITGLQTGLPEIWWRNPQWVEALNLTAEQQKKMDEIVQQYRLKLIDLKASLEKEELILEPLVETIRPGDEPRILAQIDQIAQARAELEKANARMLLGIRQVLTQDQWNKLPSNQGKAKIKATQEESSKTKLLKKQ